MHLILSSSSPWNASYCNESGQVLFKAEAPGWCLLGRNIKLSRVVPPSIASRDIDLNKEVFDDSKTLVSNHTSLDQDPLRDIFEPVGEVEYHVFKASHIKFRGGDYSVNDFFTRTGFGFYGRLANTINYHPRPQIHIMLPLGIGLSWVQTVDNMFGK